MNILDMGWIYLFLDDNLLLCFLILKWEYETPIEVTLSSQRSELEMECFKVWVEFILIVTLLLALLKDLTSVLARNAATPHNHTRLAKKVQAFENPHCQEN